MTVIDTLINYGLLNLNLNKLDANYVRNEIFHLLKTYDNEPFVADTLSIAAVSPHDAYIILRNYIIDNKIETDDFQIEALIDKVFGLLEPMPSMVDKEFNDLYVKSDFDAILYLKKLGVNSNYINLFNINKNIKWNTIFDKNLVEYTINLSKPEKSNADIAKALLIKSTSDDCPKCVLCYENEGYYGKFNKAPRSSIRLVSVTLNGNEWYLQLSPYVYYENHIILLNKVHSPMVINEGTLDNLVSFVDQYPHFFLGSNADLPIVGGSILSHEHYQGGTHILPVMLAGPKFEYFSQKVKNSKVFYLDWFNSCIEIETKDVNELKEIYHEILTSWKGFDDIELGIKAMDDDVRHNTITPILRKDNGVYKLFLILRCNCTSSDYPEGIFHVHPEYFNIKKEGIGLIEAQGLFILPGRLESEIDLISKYLAENLDLNEYLTEHPNLIPHKEMMAALKEKVDIRKDIHQQVYDHISMIGREILKNTAVFKENQVEHLDKFMKATGFERK